MPLEDAYLALAGISTGDAFGNMFFALTDRDYVRSRIFPSGTWRWTDDTQATFSVVEELKSRGWIDPLALTRRMTWWYSNDPDRGYNETVRMHLEQLKSGKETELDPAAMGRAVCSVAVRTIPIGAFFRGNITRAIREARNTCPLPSPIPDYTAAPETLSIAAAVFSAPQDSGENRILDEILASMPPSELRDRLKMYSKLPSTAYPEAITLFRAEADNSPAATIPFAIWMAARFGEDFPNALWLTVNAKGVRDTTCAIVGGLSALRNRHVPDEWLRRREKLPLGFEMAPVGTQELRSLVSRPPIPRGSQAELQSAVPIRLDPLTMLPNLLGFIYWLDDTSRPSAQTKMQITVFQLVGLPEVNHNLGRKKGDDWLIWTSDYLCSLNAGSVFRIGGDKFALCRYNTPATLPNGQDTQSILTRIEQNGKSKCRAIVLDSYPGLHATSGMALSAIYYGLQPENFTTERNIFYLRDVRQAQSLRNLPTVMNDVAAHFHKLGNTADETLRQAQTDVITQLPNMRAATTALEEALAFARANQSKLAVLLVDGDNLRNFNQISYEAGDEAIRQLGYTMRDQLRENDFIARWRTGDEFLIILPEAGTEQAHLVADRLCRSVSQASINWLLRTTVSVGISIYPNSGTSLQELISSSEDGLATAKKQGKNAVRVGVPARYLQSNPSGMR